MMNVESCGSCKFFRRHVQNLKEGFCKRFPPVVVIAPIDGKMRPVSASADMAEADWCGEYRARVLQ